MHCFRRNSMHKARDRPKACMLQVKVLLDEKKTNKIVRKTIKHKSNINRITLTVRRQCLLETFDLRRQCFPDLKISVEAVPVLMLAHIEPHRKKQPSKISWTSISVERVSACTNIHDRALIQELRLKT